MSLQIIYYLSLIFYFFQTLSFLAPVRVFGGVALIFLLAISIYFWWRTMSNKIIRNHPIVFFSNMMLLLYLLLCLAYPSNYNDYSPVDRLKNVSIFFLQFFPVYYWNATNSLRLKYLKIFIITAILLSIPQFYALNDKLLDLSGGTKVGVTNNGGQIFATLIPISFLLFWKNKKYFIILFGILASFILMSVKREAIICLIISLIFIYYYYLRTISYRHILRNIVFSIVTITALTYYISDMISHNEYFQYRIQSTLEGDSSNRDIIFAKIFDDWYYTSDMSYFFFGEGLTKSIQIAGIDAHNDWLNSITNTGLLGTLIYMSLLLSIGYTWKKCNNSFEKIVVLLVLFRWILGSMVSRIIYSCEDCFLMITLGYISSNIIRNRYKLNPVNDNLVDKQNG